jgi:hypothetical protein
MNVPKSSVGLLARASCSLAKWFEARLAARFRVGGVFRVECVAPDGTVRWVAHAKNGVSNSALDDILNKYFRNGTTASAWYLGLVDNAGFTALAAADTIASHSGWSEATYYSNANRPTWSPAASSGQSVVNGTTSDFNINANTKAVKGLFTATDNTVGGTSGILFSTAAFTGGVQNCNSGDTLKCTYTMSAASG